MIEIEDLREDHLPRLAAVMRSADVAEVMAADGSDPLDALKTSFARSTMAWAALVNGEVAAAFGVAPYFVAGGVGRPWLLTGPAMERHPIEAARKSRKAVAHMLDHYGRLENWVDARHGLAIKWLRWLGFTIEEAKPVGIGGAPFHFFWMER